MDYIIYSSHMTTVITCFWSIIGWLDFQRERDAGRPGDLVGCARSGESRRQQSLEGAPPELITFGLNDYAGDDGSKKRTELVNCVTRAIL